MSWLSKLEKKWRHLIDDLGGFLGTIVDFSLPSFAGWYSISKWIREYETYYNVSSTPLIDDWNTSNLLNGAVLSNVLDPRIELNEYLKDAALNSMYSRFHHIAKKVSTDTKYRDILTKPIGTEFNTKISIKSLQFATGLSNVTDYDFCTFNSLFHSYNYLIDTYGFIANPDTIIVRNLQQIEKRVVLGTLTYNDKEYFVSNVYPKDDYVHINIFRVKTREEITNNSSSYVEEIDITTPIEVLQGSYYYIYYDDNGVTRIEIFTVGSNPNLDNLFVDSTDYQYPTFTLKALGVYTKEDRFRKDLDLYGANEKLLKRSSLDWKDIYEQILCNVDKETSEDKSYKDSLKDTTNILIGLACDITTNNQTVIEYMYKLFNQYALEHDKGTGELFYKHAFYEHKVLWDSINISTKKGHVCNWKQYAAESKNVSSIVNEVLTSYGSSGISQQIIQRTKTDKVLSIYYQKTKDTYIEITVTGLRHITNALGKEIKTDLPTFSNMKPRTRKEIEDIIENRKYLDENSNTDNSEFLLPLYPVIVRKLGSFKGSTLLAISLRVVWQSKKRIKKKWYATTGFTVIRIIASIVIIICTWGSATPLVLAANAAANIALNVLLQVLMALAIKLAIKYVCKVFHIDGYGLLVANVFSTLIQIGLTAQIGDSYGIAGSLKDSMNIIGLGSGIGGMVVNKEYSLNGIANLTSSTAFISLAGTNPVMASIYNLIQNPEYLKAIQDKNWSTVLITTTATIAEAFSINSAAQSNESVSNSDFIKAQERSAIVNTIVETPSAILSEEAQKNQESLQELQINLAKLQRNYLQMQRAFDELTQKNKLINSIILSTTGV